jgi:hypothetical protein
MWTVHLDRRPHLLVAVGLSACASGPSTPRAESSAYCVQWDEAHAGILRAQGWAESGDHRRAAIAYLESVQHMPELEHAAEFLWNASVELERAGYPEEARSVRIRLCKEHPGAQPLRMHLVDCETGQRTSSDRAAEIAAAPIAVTSSAPTARLEEGDFSSFERGTVYVLHVGRDGAADLVVDGGDTCAWATGTATSGGMRAKLVEHPRELAYAIRGIEVREMAVELVLPEGRGAVGLHHGAACGVDRCGASGVPHHATACSWQEAAAHCVKLCCSMLRSVDGRCSAGTPHEQLRSCADAMRDGLRKKFGLEVRR